MNRDAEDIYLEAWEIESPEERAVFLDRACAHNPSLRACVDQMFADEEQAENFFSAKSPLEKSEETPTVIHPSSASLNSELTAPFDGRKGQQIGSYQLLEQIGEGGFGTVWLAEQTEPVKRRVALKIIKPGMDTKEVIARFEAERQALAMMNHPNIARVLDAGATASGRPYFVMELVEGLSVTRFCQERKMSTKQRLELFSAICSAVNHAHQKGIIHRDLKPSNVIVSDQDPGGLGVPKVIDFGIAKATEGKLTDKTLCTRLGQFIGTPAYMSPEQAGLEPDTSSDIDTRSDIYSLGVLLYELLTGNPPFDAQSLLVAGYDEMRRIIREVEPPRPSLRISSLAVEERTLLGDSHQTEASKLSRLIHGDLDWIVMKAMEKDRTRRYQTANDFAADIKRFLDYEPVVATPPSLRYRAVKFVRRHKAKLAAAVALTIALLAGTALSTWQAIRATREAARAVLAEDLAADRFQKAERLSGEIREQLIRSHTASGVDRLRAGEPSLALPWLVRALELNQGSVEQQTLPRVRIAQVLQYVPQLHRSWSKPGPAAFVKFSADGNYVLASGATHGAKGRADGGLGLWEVSSGLPVELDGINKEDVLWADFSPRDPWLAAITRSREIRLWDLRKGGAPILFEKTHPQGHHLVFSSDGTKLLSYGYNRLARLWDVGTGRMLISRFDIKAGSNLRGADFSPDGRRVSILNYNGYTHTLDVETGQSVFPAVIHRGDAVDVQYIPTGKQFATSGWSDGPAIYFWDAATGARVAVLKQDRKISSFDISPDGAAIATVSYEFDGHLQLWNARTFERIAPPIPQTAPLSDVKFSPDSQHLATASWNQTARLWDAQTGQSAGSTMWHSAAVQSLAFHPSGQFIMTGCVDGTVRIWSIARGAIPSLVLRPKGGADQIALDESGEHLLIANDQGTIQSWNTSDGKQESPTIMVGNAVKQAEFLRGGKLAVTASLQPAVQLWDLDAGTVHGLTMKPSPSWDVAKAVQPAFAINPDGTKVVAAFSTASESRFRVWDTTTREAVREEVQGTPLRYFEMTRDGRYFAVARGLDSALGHELTFYSTETGESVGPAIGLEGFIAVGAFSPDGKTFALVTQTSPGYNLPDFSVLHAWNVESGEVVAPSVSWSGDTGVLRYDPEGRRMVVSQAHRLRILDVKSGRPLTPHMVHQRDIADVRFSPNGLYLGSIDGTDLLYLHDAATGQPLTIPIPHPAPIIRLCFTPDNRRLITACRDGLVRFWDLTPELSPAGDLTKLSQLVSGHEIDEMGALSPLPTSDGENQWQAWVELRGGLPRLTSEADDGRITPTLAALSSLAVSHMTAGRVTEALSYLEEASIRNPADTIAAMKLAALQVWFGKDAEYANHCRRMLDWAEHNPEASTAERVGKLICLRPIEEPIWRERVLSLTYYAVEVGKTDWALPWFQLALGMAEYRSGDYGAADQTLEKARLAPPSEHMADHLRRTAGLYQAMSQYRQGKVTEAKKLYGETVAKIKSPPGENQSMLDDDIHVDDLILWLAHREARALFYPPSRQSP